MCHVLDDPDLWVTCKKKSSPTGKFDPVAGKITIKSIIMSDIQRKKIIDNVASTNI